MKEEGNLDSGVKHEVVYVEIIGAGLVTKAVEGLLQTQPGFDVTNDASDYLPGPHIVLLLGQEGVALLKRRPLRPGKRRQEHFVLITNGAGIDFRLARDLPIRVFIGTDDSLPLFFQGLRAAAAGCNFCSPQVVPSLLAATSSASGNVLEPSGTSATIAAPLHFTARENRPAELPASSEKGGALSEEMRYALRRGLSNREAEIALQAAQGLSNQQIADAANVTLSTVKFHLYRVYQKLGIKRRSQLSQLTLSAEQKTLVQPTR